MSNAAPRSPDVRTWIFLGTLVAALIGVVIWSLSSHPPDISESAVDSSTPRGDGAVEYTTSPLLVVHPPKQASCEVAVVTDRSEEELRKLTDPAALGAMLMPRHCGNSCAQLRELVKNRALFEAEVRKADDYILPPEDSWTTIAPTLDAVDRTRLHRMANLVVIEAHHPTGTAHLGARTCFAVTQALSESVNGYVYDETLRRIETTSAFAAHAIVEPESQNVVRADRYVVQSYRESGGTFRFVTLGLIRFGVFDFEARDIPASRTTEASVMIARVARMLAMGQRWPFALEPERSRTANAGTQSIRLDFIEGVPTEGDPDSLGGRLLPLEASWDVAFTKLFGPAGSVQFDLDNPLLLAIANRTRGKIIQLENARAGGARLLVKYRLHVKDADADVEEVWMLASKCTRTQCEGQLQSTPSITDDLRIGDEVQTPLADVVDAIVERPDGGREGGESERVLR